MTSRLVKMLAIKSALIEAVLMIDPCVAHLFLLPHIYRHFIFHDVVDVSLLLLFSIR